MDFKNYYVYKITFILEKKVNIPNSLNLLL